MDSLSSLAVRGFELALKLSLPVLLATVLIGLVIAVIQAATQVQEQALGTAAKLIVGTLVLLVTKEWLGSELTAFSRELFDLIRAGKALT